jgi:hypothetical protein
MALRLIDMKKLSASSLITLVFVIGFSFWDITRIRAQDSQTVLSPSKEGLSLKKRNKDFAGVGLPLVDAFDQASLVLIVQVRDEDKISISRGEKIQFSNLFVGQSVGVLDIISDDGEINWDDFNAGNDSVVFPSRVEVANPGRHAYYIFVFLKKTEDHQYMAIRVGDDDANELPLKYPLEKVLDPEVLTKKIKIFKALGAMFSESRGLEEKVLLDKYIFALFRLKSELKKSDFSFFPSMDSKSSEKEKLVFNFWGTGPFAKIELNKKKTGQVVYKSFSIERDYSSVSIPKFNDVLNKEVTFPLTK